MRKLLDEHIVCCNSWYWLAANTFIDCMNSKILHINCMKYYDRAWRVKKIVLYFYDKCIVNSHSGSRKCDEKFGPFFAQVVRRARKISGISML